MGEKRHRRAALTVIRLNFIVEGQTEETFVNDVLIDHLSGSKVYGKVRRVETGRKGGSIFRGGMTNYAKAKRDINRWLREDRNSNARFTTMFDLYALPVDFPDYDTAVHTNDPYERAAILEDAIKDDIGDPRLIPYIQLYEFEALLLSDPQKLETEFPDAVQGIRNLMDMAARFESPECIDSGQNSAPSKRITKEIPSYFERKASSGPIVAAEIGIQTLKTRCRHFGQWLSTLEQLNN